MRFLRDVLGSGILASLLVTAAFAQTPREYDIDIPAGPAPQALQQLIRQTSDELAFDDQTLAAFTTRPVKGRFTLIGALERMLENTGMTYRLLNQRMPAVVPAETAVAAAPRAESLGQGAHGTADVDRRGRTGGTTASPPGELEFVTVVGTFIRGIDNPVGSSSIRIDRRDIERTGHSTLRGVVRALPQNFGGGASEAIFVGGEADSNVSRGTAVNLRGTGPEATVVLVGGRRVAPSGSNGTYVDISLFPLIAIEEITILPDGASVAYGSDAVGGVVNLGLRERYEGRETRLHYGSVTDGSLHEWQVSQLLGHAWDEGSALLAVQYSDRSALPGAERAQMASDLRGLGGDNFDTQFGNPGTLMIGPSLFAIPRGQDGRSLTPADFIAGSVNLYNQHAGRDILGNERLVSALATVRHHVTGDLKLHGDLLVSHRDTTAQGPGFRQPVPLLISNAFYPFDAPLPVTVAYDFGADLGLTTLRGDVRGVNAGVGATLDLRTGWRLATQFTHSETREHVRTGGLLDFIALIPALADPNPQSAFNPLGDGSHTSAETIARIRAQTQIAPKASLDGVNVVASGPLWQLPAGDMQLALGGDFRRDAFESVLETLSSSDPDGSLGARRSSLARDYRAGFAELLIPLAGETWRRRGLEHLQFSIAGRFDSYAGFDSAFSPKFGVSWSPVLPLSLRGTWSTSFRAPSLAHLVESANRSAIAPLADPQAPGGVSPVLLWLGGNADLREEHALTRTLGAAFHAQDFEIGATYFDIELRDRIRSVATTPNVLRDPAFADIVSRPPSPEQLAEVCARSRFVGPPGGCLNTPVAALVDARINNTQALRTRGMDVAASWDRATRAGDFDFDISASRVLEYSRAERRTSPRIDVLDTEDDPLDFRLRSSLAWRLDPIEASVSVNYSDGYADTLSQPNRRVGSWTTVDAWLAVRPRIEGFLAGTRISLSAQNVFDDLPPFLNNPAGIGYDPANADLTGRFVSLQVGLDW